MENLGVLSGINIYPQPTPGSDAGITAGFALDLAGTKVSYVGGRKLVEVVNIKRKRRSPGQITGKADASGVVPCNISANFRNMARILALHVGADGYSRVGGLHTFRFSGAPGMFQVEREHDDTGSPVTSRQCENISDMISFKFSEDGAGQFDWTPSGSGRRVVNTPIAGPPTLADEDFVATSYFDAFLNRNGSAEEECSSLTFDLKNAAKRQGKIMSGRGIGTKYAGNPRVGGKMGIIFTDYDFLNDAINGADVPIECLWGSADPTIGSPFYMRQRMNVRFEDVDEDAGGEDMVLQEQSWASCFPAAGAVGFGAEIIVPNMGPFTIPASSHLGFIKDGGGTVDVPVTAGVHSMADIVANAMAVGGFTTIAGGDLLAGHGRFKLSAPGSGHNFKIDTTLTGSIHALLGLDNVARVGVDPIDWICEVMTDLAVDLA